MKYLSLLILLIPLLASCITNVVCEGQYIQVGQGCCLDEDGNGICDSEESKDVILENIEPETPEIIDTVPEEIEQVKNIEPTYQELQTSEEFSIEDFITGDRLGTNNIANDKDIFTTDTNEIFASFKYNAAIIDRKYIVKWFYYDQELQDWQELLDQVQTITNKKLRSFSSLDSYIWSEGYYKVEIYYNTIPIARVVFEIKS